MSEQPLRLQVVLTAGPTDHAKAVFALDLAMASAVSGVQTAVFLTLDATADDVPGWDSFAHVNLIVAIEEAFDVTFTTTEIGAIKSVGDIIRALEAKHAAS